MFNQKEYQRKWRQENKEKIKEYRRKWRKKNPEKERERSKKWRIKNIERVRKVALDYYYNNKEKYKLLYEKNKDIINQKRKLNPLCRRSRRKERLKKYGITSEIYNQMFLKQKGRCAICECLQDDKFLAVDHCHKTGKVRGLLCCRCNLALGLSDDNVYILQKMINYLKTHSE